MDLWRLFFKQNHFKKWIKPHITLKFARYAIFICWPRIIQTLQIPSHHTYLNSRNLALNGDHSPSLHKPSPYKGFHNKNIKLRLSWHKFQYTQVFKKKNQNMNMKEWEKQA